MTISMCSPRDGKRLRIAGVLLLIGLAGAGPTFAADNVDVTAPFTLDFNVSRAGLPLGTSTFTLTANAQQPGCYVYRGKAVPNAMAALLIGEIQETSHFCVRDGVVKPQTFRHHIAGEPDKSYTLTFDWAAHEARYKREDGKTKTVALGETAYDPLSIQIAARHWLATSGDPADLEDKGFPLIDGDDLKTYTLQVGDGGTIKTPQGNYQTLLVSRAGKHKHRLKLWLARGADWLPVHVEQAEGDDGVYRMTLTGMTLTGLKQPAS